MLPVRFLELEVAVLWRCESLGRGVAAAAALGLAALRPVLFLNAYEAQAATVLADDPRPLDALREPPEEPIKALRFAELYVHTDNSPS